MIQELEHAGTPFLTVLLLTVILGFALNPLARGLGWVDQPDWRKQHSGDIPLAGGPASAEHSTSAGPGAAPAIKRRAGGANLSVLDNGPHPDF